MAVQMVTSPSRVRQFFHKTPRSMCILSPNLRFAPTLTSWRRQPGRLKPAVTVRSSIWEVAREHDDALQAIYQLSSPDAATRLAGVKALQEHVEDYLIDIRTFVSTGAYTALSEVLEDGNWDIKDPVLSCLELLFKYIEKRSAYDAPADVVAPALVAMLVKLSNMTDEEVQSLSKVPRAQLLEKSARLMQMLPYHHAAIAAAEGAIPLFVELLDEKDEEVCIHAAKALQWLAVNHCSSQDAIADADAIPKLIQMMDGGTSSLQATAARTLCCLALYNSSVADRLKAKGVLNRLPESQRGHVHQNSACKDNADHLEDFVSVTEEDAWRDRIAEQVMRLSSSDAPTQAVAAFELSITAVQPCMQHILTSCLQETGATQALSRALCSTDWDLKVSAAYCMWRLASSSPRFVQSMRAGEVAPVLVMCCKQLEEMGVKELQQRCPRIVYADMQLPAVGLLALLAKQQPFTVAAAGAIPLLVKQLDTGHQGGLLQLYATQALQHLARACQAHQDAIFDMGALPKLRAFLELSDIGLHAPAAEAIGLLALHNPRIKYDIRDMYDRGQYGWQSAYNMLYWKRVKAVEVLEALSRLLLAVGIQPVPGDTNLCKMLDQLCHPPAHLAKPRDGAAAQSTGAAATDMPILVQELMKADNSKTWIPHSLTTALLSACAGNGNVENAVGTLVPCLATEISNRQARDRLQAEGLLTKLTSLYKDIDEVHSALTCALMVWHDIPRDQYEDE